MLKVENLDVYYGDVQVLKGVSLDVNEGELVAVIGGNGAGKTTLLRTISGLHKCRGGKVTFEGKDITNLPPHEIVACGLSLVPEGRLLFSDMSVRENLEMGGFTVQDKAEMATRLDHVLEMFPRLKERLHQMSGTLSGGEQQMLTVGRALMAKPRLIIFDEPSLGLAPIMVERLFEIILKINETVTVLLIEQNVRHSCEISERAFVLENGHVVLKGTGKEMLESDHVRKVYLGL